MKINKSIKRNIIVTFYGILILALILSIIAGDTGVAFVAGGLLFSTGCAALVWHEEKIDEAKLQKFREARRRGIIMQEDE